MPNSRLVHSLKSRGHQLLEEIEALGVDRNTTYKWLADDLGVITRFAHFRHMYSLGRLYRAIEYLEGYKLALEKESAGGGKPREEAA